MFKSTHGLASVTSAQGYATTAQPVLTIEDANMMDLGMGAKSGYENSQLGINLEGSVTSINNKPNVGMMPNYPKKQGKMFAVALGQNVSFSY